MRPAPPDLPFPHVNRVWLVERYVHDPAGTPTSAIAALGVTNLCADRAGPAHLAGFVKDHWGIESLHWLRDTVYREDHSRVRTRTGPRVMAGLRNLGIGALHLAGRRDITEATRWAGRFMHRSLPDPRTLAMINDLETTPKPGKKKAERYLLVACTELYTTIRGYLSTAARTNLTHPDPDQTPPGRPSRPAITHAGIG